MNKSALKKYAPQARLDFIAAVTRRAELLGLNPESPAQVEKQGEALLINGRAFPAAYGQMRTTLEARIRDQGFAQVMEAMAYTWFNRLVAVRYMELHGFLDHGYRVLSHPANTETGHTQPEILDHIADLDLPGLDKSVALELKLAGNKDEELYREVLLAQCHALHQAMPFLFESLDDATELLLPDGLLRTDSILGKLVTAIDEADWQDVEIIGWLYQFYISEKKDQVIGKVVKSEDIPAATQLFTPNWIVKYLVQNSLGRLWLMANPTSTLATKWEYYIKPAEQTPEVNAQLDALIQARIDEDGATLNPESLTLLDPACGSGHILVEAYDLLRDIYLERGYRRQDIPRLILEKNLYGLDIDDRAAQLAGFALLMKARADDRRLFGQPIDLNVLALQESKVGSAEELHSALSAPEIDSATVKLLVETFNLAKTFGSLIQVPTELLQALPNLQKVLEASAEHGDMLERDAASWLSRLVKQAHLLGVNYDSVVVNPPYMGLRAYSPALKKYVEANYSLAKHDLYACFIERSRLLSKDFGVFAVVAMNGWMFLGSFKAFRENLLKEAAAQTIIDFGSGAFGNSVGTVVKTAIGIFSRNAISGYVSTYCKLSKSTGSNQFKVIKTSKISCDSFLEIPESPLFFEASDAVRSAFVRFRTLDEVAQPRQGLASSDDSRFMRLWHEISIEKIGFGMTSLESAATSGKVWFPINKGGKTRKWYGNNELVIDWEGGGRRILDYAAERYGSPTRTIKNIQYYFQRGITWTLITGDTPSFRCFEPGFIITHKGPAIYLNDIGSEIGLLGYLNSKVARSFLNTISPNFGIEVGHLKRLPIKDIVLGQPQIEAIESCVSLAEEDWNCYENSWGFRVSPTVIRRSAHNQTIQSCHAEMVAKAKESIDKMCCFEEENNKYFSSAYGLENEITPDVTRDQITLSMNPAYRYGGKVDESVGWSYFQSDCMVELVSYSLGCIMGRYSLDAPGLIYAHAGNEGFDPSRYETFPADDDGIVPITDEAWFDDDGANRIREFVRVVWGEETEAENMAWLAESLGQKASESADDSIRRYLSRDFYKDHLQTYKKRPIYWLFSSGKHKAFEALVYLHRYNAGTLSRMRMEYVVPLQSRMQARIDNLDQDIQSSTSSAEQKRFQKQKDKLIKQLDELRRFDENLRHYADQRITLDLDDGVKVNYGKFGDLLAEVKAVTGRVPSKND